VLQNRVCLGLDTETLLCYVPISREIYLFVRTNTVASMSS